MRALLLLLALALPARGQEVTLVPTRAIRAATVIGPGDVTLIPGGTPGALSDPALAIGQEARITLYPGRPIDAGSVGPPALIERNALVTLSYARGQLAITTEGRALDRGGAGDLVRVMNLASRTIITGRVSPMGIVEVGR